MELRENGQQRAGVTPVCLNAIIRRENRDEDLLLGANLSKGGEKA